MLTLVTVESTWRSSLPAIYLDAVPSHNVLEESRHFLRDIRYTFMISVIKLYNTIMNSILICYNSLNLVKSYKVLMQFACIYLFTNSLGSYNYIRIM
jgi:hypothetical protein